MTFCLLSWQTSAAVPLIELQLFVSDVFLTILFCQIRLHYLLFCRNRIRIEYLVQPFFKLKLSHFIHVGISEISLCSPGLIVLIFIWNNVSQRFWLFYFLNYYMACYLYALRKRKGKEEYLYSAILVRTHTLKALRRWGTIRWVENVCLMPCDFVRGFSFPHFISRYTSVVCV